MKRQLLLLSTIILTLLSGYAYASVLSVETDYRIRGIDYTHTELLNESNSDLPLAYYSQRVNLSISGKFNKGIEIWTKLTALGVVGSSQTYFAVPYPNTDLVPYVENAYIKMNNLGDSPVSLSVGKQPLCFGDGLIVCDNNTGFNAIVFSGNYDLNFSILSIFKNIHLPVSGKIFTAKLNETLRERADSDIYGGSIGLDIWGNLFEVGYFEESDFSRTEYLVQNSLPIVTRSIVKNFLDFRLGKKDKISRYQLEFAKQGGFVKKLDGKEIYYDGLYWSALGSLTGEKTKLGKVTATALLSVASGDDNTLGFDNDESFAPTHTKKYDGLERAGYGKIFGATSYDSFFRLPDEYSGINTLGIKTEVSPSYSLTFMIDYYLFSASKGPKVAPEASGFERFYGAEFSLGSEMDLSVSIANTKYSSVSFTYASYSPPKTSIYWPFPRTISSLILEVTAKF